MPETITASGIFAFSNRRYIFLALRSSGLKPCGRALKRHTCSDRALRAVEVSISQ